MKRLNINSRLIIYLGLLNIAIGGFWIISEFIISQYFGHKPLYGLDQDPTASNLTGLINAIALTFIIEIPLIFIYLILIVIKFKKEKRFIKLEYLGMISFIAGLAVLIYYRLIDENYFLWLMD